jgi:hypothetical protein
MPILGIIASSFRSAAGPVGAYDALATVTLSSATATVEFVGIPTGYKHLQVRALLKLTGNAGVNYNQPFYLGTGGVVDTGTNYARHGIRGNGSTVTAVGATATSAYVYDCAPSYSTAIFGTTIIDILDYANVNKYKTVRGLSGVDANGSGGVNLASSLWLNTGAVTNIRFTADVNNYEVNTQFALFGVK